MAEVLIDAFHGDLIKDTDSCFVIDKFSREITYKGTAGRTLIQFDHNSERFTFRLPRYIDNHDMAECNRVEVHYINIGTGGTNKHKDLYLPDDLHVDPEDPEYVLCSWLISRNATSLAGSLNFLLNYVCMNGDVSDYAWHTGIYKGVKIGDGLDNVAAVVEQNGDALEQWKQDLANAGILSVDEIREAKKAAIAELHTAKNTIEADAKKAVERHVDEQLERAGSEFNEAHLTSLAGIHAAKDEAVQTVLAASTHVGENGNWIVGGKDTGVQAQGPQGPKGDTGVSAPISGFFTLSVDENGDLYVYAEEGETPNFEFDRESGNLYIVQER